MAAGSITRQDQQPVFVLHTYPFKETSLVVEFFSRDFGRIAAVAKGARRPRSAMRGMLQSFQPLLAAWSGKSELRNLHALEWGEGLLLLNGEPIKMAGANRAADHPKYGSMEPAEVVEQDLRLMKEAGLEMMRIIHYPVDERVVEWADRLSMPLPASLRVVLTRIDDCRRELRFLAGDAFGRELLAALTVPANTL